MTGQVVALVPGAKQVRIAHDEVPGYMEKMTMPFAVRDLAELEGLAPGDLVEVRLHVTATEEWIDQVRKTGHRALAKELTDAPPPPLDLFDPGDAVDAPRFTSQDGVPFTLESLRGKVVAVTFTYTRCPLPDYCPLMDRRFREAQDRVLASSTLRGRVHFVTLSFDAPHDTPAVLAAHAARVGARRDVWTFATAPTADVDAFGGRLGLTVMRESDAPAGITHNLRTAVITPAGTLSTILRGNDWTTDALVAALEGASR
jgi:protein SCO1/2